MNRTYYWTSLHGLVLFASLSFASARYCSNSLDCPGTGEPWCCSNECCSWEDYSRDWNDNNEEIVKKGLAIATWVIAVIVIVIVLSIIGCIVACVICCRRQSQQNPGRVLGGAQQPAVMTHTHAHPGAPPPRQPAYPMGPAPGYVPPGHPQPTAMPYQQPGYPTGQGAYQPGQPGGYPAEKQAYPAAQYPAQPPSYQAAQPPPTTTDFSQASAPPNY